VTWIREELLDFDGNPDLDPDPGISKGFTSAVLAVVNAPHCAFISSPE